MNRDRRRLVWKTRAYLGLFTALAVFAPHHSAAQGSTVTGKWHLIAQTEDGERVVEPVFQQNGDQVTGKWGDSAVKGTFSDGKLDLAFPYNSDEAGRGTLKIKGVLKGNVLTGTWEFEGYTGAFKATRSPTNS